MGVAQYSTLEGRSLRAATSPFPTMACAVHAHPCHLPQPHSLLLSSRQHSRSAQGKNIGQPRVSMTRFIPCRLPCAETSRDPRSVKEGKIARLEWLPDKQSSTTQATVLTERLCRSLHQTHAPFGGGVMRLFCDPLSSFSGRTSTFVQNCPKHITSKSPRHRSVRAKEEQCTTLDSWWGPRNPP